jgi:hypothetical protein
VVSVIHVQTWLRSPDGEFVRVESCEWRPVDAQYVEGAIDLVVDGVSILSVAEWDYVDQLWSYIVNAISALREAGEASTYFPDQPIMLKLFRSSPGRILVSCEIGTNIRRVNVSEIEFLKALKVAGTTFFVKMKKLLPENSEVYELARQLLAE